MFSVIVVRKAISDHALVRWIFTAIGYFITVLALLLYAWYASNGKADSLQTAAHIHVIMAPLVLIDLSLALHMAGVVLTLIVWAIRGMPSDD